MMALRALLALIAVLPLLLMACIIIGWMIFRPRGRRTFKPYSLHPTKGYRGT